MARKQVTVYAVQPVHWAYNDEYYYREDEGDPEGDRLMSLKSFLRRDRAEAHLREAERRHRRGLNPFNYGGYGERLADYGTLAPAQFQERLRELGLQPPDLGRRGRAPGHALWEWWEQAAEGMTAEQQDGVWELLDRVRFYTVVPLQVELEG
jgi:hypothetical protein